jgi:uncharacterized protein DUF3617
MRLPNRLIPALLAAAIPALACAAPNMQEGNWEVTTKMEMEGMPFQMPPMKHNQCMTRQDVVPSAKKDQSCVVKDQKVSGDTVTWRVTCKDRDGTTEGDGKVTYAGKTYAGAMNMKVTDKRGKATSVRYQMQGRHTGPCAPAGQPQQQPKQNKKSGDY